MSNDKIDTGTGGFPIGEGQTRLSYDVGTEDSEDIPRVPWSPGDVRVDNRKKDVSRSTRSTLAAYMSDTTLGKTPSSPSPVRNAYPINHVDGLDPTELSLNDQKGYPTNPDVALNAYGKSETYVPGKVLSSRSSAATNLEVLRGRQEGTGKVDGNKLLKNATPDGADPRVINPSAKGGVLPQIGYTKSEDLSKEIKNYYGSPNPGNISNSVIYNRFNPENLYEDNAGINSPQFAKKYPLGHNLPPNAAERNVTYGRLAQIGNALSIRAGLELKSLSEGNNPTDNASVAGAVLPGSTQLGVYRLEREQLEAASVLETLTTEGIDDNLLINPAKQSWGTLNNVLDQYAGISNFGMQLLAVALIVALSLVIVLISRILPGVDVNLSDTVKSSDERGIRPLGKSYSGKDNRIDYSSLASIVSQGSNFSIWGLLGFPPTARPLSKCLGAGVLLFFGIIPGSDFSLGNLAEKAAVEGAKSGMKNPGYYTVMARSINRSFLLISDSLLSLGRSFASGNFVTGIQQSLEFVNVFRESKFMGSLRVFSRLGDAYLSDYENPQLDGPRHKSRIDYLPDDNSLKGRISNTLKLSWSSQRARDLLIYPKGMKSISVEAIQKLDAPPEISTSNLADITDKNKKQASYSEASGKDRIDPDVRIKMEDFLDAEYVPFYFHDVRTNEILSFHAFLASLSDDYSATYDSSEGFGRVEPIKTYKGTQRKIGFSFYVAATSEQDFSVMWDKINKLVTLVYPQYTEGRILTTPDKNYNIHMPFSQTIQASPMVRVRIGDLIRSNYSKFNLARLFGYTYNNTKFNNVENPAAQEGKKDAVVDKDRAISKAYSPGRTFLLEEGTQIADGEFVSCSTERFYEEKSGLPDGIILKLKEGPIEKNNVEYYVFDFVIDDKASDQVKAKINENPYTKSLLSARYMYNGDRIKFTDETKKIVEEELIRLQSEANASQYTLNVDSFLSEENNSIVKSFKSVGGKGLAGFIESMNFDWYDRVTWEIDEKNQNLGKAPKMCKVTISFSPIHDISPGLDHEGGNRAPIYPVGRLFRKD